MRLFSLLFITTSLLIFTGFSNSDLEIEKASKKGFKQFLKMLDKEVETHNWESVVQKCDPEHYSIQVDEIGIHQAQYIAEIFGLNTVGNSIGTGSVITFSDLNRIEKLKWKRRYYNNSIYKATGYIILIDGSRLNIEVMVRNESEKFFLTGPVG